jgi:cell division protein FtsW (lipid II flippase)
MALQTNGLKQRSIERFFLLLVSIVLLLLFMNLYTALQKDFALVPQRMSDGTMVNLNGADAAQRVKTALQKRFYFEDARDIRLATSVLEQRLGRTGGVLDNIGELNKHHFYVDAEQAFAVGGESFQKRVQLSRSLLGFAGSDSLRFREEMRTPPALPAALNIGLGKAAIRGDIQNEEDAPVAGVLVRLTMLVSQDSVYSNTISEATKQTAETTGSVVKHFAFDSANNRQLVSLTAYARTDASGEYSFKNLPEGKAFEVLPLQPRFQFGPSKGTAALEGVETFSFTQRPHTIRLFSTRDFNTLKREKAMIVRTPQEFNRWFWIITAGFFISFLLLHLFLSLRFPEADGLLLPAVMLLTGLSFITLLGIQDALSDRFLAKAMFGYFMAGVAGQFVLLHFNLRRFTTDSGLYRLFINNPGFTSSGLPWAALAGLLLLLTILFGSGPEGSGVKVNLFGFQPSELVKFLTVLFLAGFFAVNETFISEYGRWQKRWIFFRIALLAIVGTVLLFLMLGDLGPAIVCCFTFIVLFSFSRGDFPVMAGAVLLYVLAVWGFENVWIATGITAALLAAYFFWNRKGFSESAVMALVVLAAFLLLDQIPLLDRIFPGPVSRLIDRKAIWQNAWDNEVFGGDHVANSIWAVSSGGLTGQGFDNSFAKTIPEAHTDMILPSIGEHFGLVVVVSVCLLFLLYLHRALLIGRQTGTPFLFYLCAGIGVSTFIQFLLIAGGSIGALPLSGVSLPLVSYGGSSLVCNLLAAGFLLSASSVRGTILQMRHITKRQDGNLVPVLVAACAGVLLLGINISRYTFGNKKWIVQPALVADRSGARQFSFNPRIPILMKRLQAGSLYDRNQLLIATSKPEQIKLQQDSLLAAGLERHNLDVLKHRRQDRYYPFGAHLFFWTGDANTGIFTGGNNGYFAEYRHGAELRGFETAGTTQTAVATRFRENRFMPQKTREMALSKPDYAALAPLLLAGINSNEVTAFKQRNRDVQLAIDARLQTRIQRSLLADATLQGKRVSVVVMEDSTGDVLASAAYPLPPVEDWERLNLTMAEQQQLANPVTINDPGFTLATQPGSTAKLATALAAFNKLGDTAAHKTFLVREEDRIRIRSDEPDETGVIGMERAIVKSNNVYFIRLANEEALEEDMVTVYQQTGMFLRGVGGYFYQRDTANVFQQARWRDLWRRTEFRSRLRYDKNNIRATRGLGISGMAWGQGELVATPAAIARLASGIAHNGTLIPNRFLLKTGDSLIGVTKGTPIAREPHYAHLLTDYMLKQSAGKAGELGIKAAGKTGTPERIVKGNRINDGWYVFFAPKPGSKNHIVVCVRIERSKGSSEAVSLSGRHVIPALLDMGYLKSFDAEKAKSVKRTN